MNSACLSRKWKFCFCTMIIMLILKTSSVKGLHMYNSYVRIFLEVCQFQLHFIQFSIYKMLNSSCYVYVVSYFWFCGYKIIITKRRSWNVCVFFFSPLQLKSVRQMTHSLCRAIIRFWLIVLAEAQEERRCLTDVFVYLRSVYKFWSLH